MFWFVALYVFCRKLSCGVVVLQHSASTSGLYALLQQQSLIQSNPALAFLLAANSLAQCNWNERALATDVPSRPRDALQAASLASTIEATCHPYTYLENAAIACHAITAPDLAPPFTTCDIVPNHLSAGFMAPLADWPYQLPVPPQPEVARNLHAEYGLEESPGSYLGSGPQRHNHLKDMRAVRHSPY